MRNLGLFGLALVTGAVAQACNGFTQLCNRRYSDITFAASHNAAFVGRTPSHNQFQYPENGMDMGIRYFTTQVHEWNGEIRQCHSSCLLLNVGTFSEIVVSIKRWLDAHPREVVTLLITNGADNIPVTEFAPVFEAAGAANMVFRPSGPLGLGNWPTLGQLIDSGQRFVVFMDYNADTNRVPYILPQFDHYVETPFSPTSRNFFNCDVDRPVSGGSASNRMIWANHNLNVDIFGVVIPAQSQAAQTNSVNNIRQQTEICVARHGRNPHVVMLDFVSEGQVIEAQRILNGL
ncbi:PLC-like phosphodiesterase [Stachybotrys elegans]|uniref:PLC-like phosphodiesterase n=1 Tax=Stachybotrys elegans TaxID=80388 RepID=A0A8K0WV07_9HYPO|nr:PLC-like phosphodiesterase [Stachybotrys elegans]